MDSRNASDFFSTKFVVMSRLENPLMIPLGAFWKPLDPFFLDFEVFLQKINGRCRSTPARHAANPYREERHPNA